MKLFDVCRLMNKSNSFIAVNITYIVFRFFSAMLGFTSYIPLFYH